MAVKSRTAVPLALLMLGVALALCGIAQGASAGRELKQVTITGPVVTQTAAVSTTCSVVACPVGVVGVCYSTSDTGPFSSACSVKVTQNAKTIQIVKIISLTKNNCYPPFYWYGTACFINV